MKNEMTLFDAIKRADELAEMMKDDLKIVDQEDVANQIKTDIGAIRKLQESAWIVLLGRTKAPLIGGTKVV